MLNIISAAAPAQTDASGGPPHRHGKWFYAEIFVAYSAK
ncbi:hypothetical protein CAter282_0212 [Collimonas arenae]|uniref:Uncharacterized protein n=1 Tax=Collimonas arenae TaxID=279058 RepID=A0A127PK31_9BURK|nr:hypothetical protein CAter10_0225 [Collimonas arenae]AMP08036.1 hypothetical protein CAter282_0212 [Collimonas arenae]